MLGHVRLVGVVVVVLGIAAPGCSTAAAPGRTGTGGQSKRVDWSADVEFVRDTIIQRHPNPFTKVRRAEFEAAAADLRAAAPGLSEVVVVTRLKQLAAMVGDAHTQVRTAVGQPPAARSLPLVFTWLSDGVFVTAAAHEYSDALGARVLAIGGRSVEEVAARVGTMVPFENRSALREQAPRWFKYPQALHALGVIPTAEHAELTIEGGAPGTPLAGAPARTIEVRSVDPGVPVRGRKLPDARGVLALSMRPRSESYWHETPDGERAIYCRYDRCQNDTGRSVAEWAEQVLAAIDREKPERVIIDLRNNPGGNSTLLWPLTGGLRRRGGEARPGWVCVLVGGATYSSAVRNAMELRERAGAVLIGQPPGQTTHHFGEVRPFTLPRSLLVLDCATTETGSAAGAADIVPDLMVDIDSASYLAGRDPVLDAALRLGPATSNP